MNPNIAFGGGGGGGKMNMRIILVAMGIFFAILFAFLGDAAVFKEPPKNHFQAILSYVTLLGYYFTDGDRLTTFFFSASVFFLVLVLIGGIGFIYLEIYIIEPIIIKRKMMYVRREKVLMNRYDDGTI